MFKTKNDGRLAELEANVADATQAVVSATAETRAAWQRVKDTRNAVEDNPDSPALGAALREAEWAHRIAREKDDASQAALMACERALAAAREAPLRVELNQKLRDHGANLGGIKKVLLPHLLALRDELWAASYPEVVARMGGPDPRRHAELVQTVTTLVEQLSDGRVEAFSKHLGVYAAAVADGSYPTRLGRNILEQQADVAAWKATDEEIRKLTAVV